jgi:hypothetical protein
MTNDEVRRHPAWDREPAPSIMNFRPGMEVHIVDPANRRPEEDLKRPWPIYLCRFLVVAVILGGWGGLCFVPRASHRHLSMWPLAASSDRVGFIIAYCLGWILVGIAALVAGACIVATAFTNPKDYK